MPGDDAHEPPLTLEEPLTLQLARRIVQGAVRGLKAAGVTVGVALILAIAVQLIVGWSIPLSVLALTLCAVASFAVGAVARRHELPPAAAATVGADGITGVSEHFRRFYPWSDVVAARPDGAELVLMVEGGYAFRIPFRDRRRVIMALARIESERAAHGRRLARGMREQRDAVEPGDEPRFIARQRQRLAVGYRHGHESVAGVIAELTDPDFQLQQRLGAAIALFESTDPEAKRALRRTRDATASYTLRDALDGLLTEQATEDQLTVWIRMMHPTPRRFAPIGAPVASIGLRIEERDEERQGRAGATTRVARDDPGQRVEDPALEEHEAVLDAAQAELDADARRRER